MTLTNYRKHKIYLSTILGYGVGSDDPEEIELQNDFKKEINHDRKKRNMGISRVD